MDSGADVGSGLLVGLGGGKGLALPARETESSKEVIDHPSAGSELEALMEYMKTL